MPPRLATWLLGLLIGPREWRETILGDLHEEYVARASSRTWLAAWSAATWYWIQSVAIPARCAAVRVRRLPRRHDAVHDQPRGDSMMRSLAFDIRCAVRSLARRPALAGLVVLTLALGLGANAAIFEMIDALVLRPFAIPDLDRLATLSETGADIGDDIKESVSPANFLDWKREARTFERVAAFDWWSVNLAGGSEPERVTGFRVTADFFPALAVPAQLGRTLAPDEFSAAGHDRRVVISDALWRRRFGGDPAVLGRTVLVDTEPYEIVGVMPRSFEFPRGTDVWGPLAFDAAAPRGSRYLTVIGRLHAGRTLDEAKSEMAVIAARLEQQYPEINKGHGARVQTLLGGMRDQGLGPMLSLWQASAIFVLLIACANVANLLLTRGAERHRELALRMAIGASRWRLVREQLVEAVVMAAASIPIALALAWFAVRLIRINLPSRVVRFVDGWQNLDLDARMIGFTSLLALATAVLFGVLPALQASRPRLNEALKDGGRGSSAGRGRQRLRRTLVIAEIALALPLLVASGLSTMGTQRFINGPQGYDPDGLLTLRIGLPDARYKTPEARRQFIAATLARLARLPGVTSAAATNVLPSGDNNSGRSIEVEGRPNPDPANLPLVDNRLVTADYFGALRLPIIRGRGFTAADRATSLPVVIVSESLAAQHFPGTDPIGRRVKLGPTGSLATIVGICGDHIHDWYGRRNYPTAFRPYEQSPTAEVVFVVRADNPGSLTAAASAAVHAVDPAQPVYSVMPMRDVLREKTVGLQYVSAIMTVFGGLALVLAIVGVYSLMAYVVTQRTHEIGVRLALGASRRDVMSLALGQAAALTAIGTIIGLGFATALGKLMEAGLLGVVSSDIRLSIAVAAVLVAAALAAGYVPARRASSIDPMAALRAD